MTDRLHIPGVGLVEDDGVMKVSPTWDLRAAPQVTFTVEDRDRRIQDNPRLAPSLKSVPLGDLMWAEHAGTTWRAVSMTPGHMATTVTLEHHISSTLRGTYGPLSAPKGLDGPQWFSSLLSLQGRAPWRVVAPEAGGLVPPVLDARIVSQLAAQQAERDTQRAPGFAKGVKLTLKSSKDVANAAQLRILATALSVADDLKAGPNARLALIAALIDEDDVRNRNVMEDHTSTGALQLLRSTAQGLGIDPLNVAAVCKGFLTHGYWRQAPHGAIALERLHPDWTPGRIAWECQGSVVGAEGYDRYVPAARKIDAAWNGSSGIAEPVSTGKTAWSIDANTSYWEAATGSQITDSGRAAFIGSGDVVYWIAESTLAKAREYATVSRFDQDVVLTPGTFDELRSIDKVSLSLPLPHTACGDVIGRNLLLTDFAVTSGTWLVTRATRSGRGDRFIQVELERPRNPTKLVAASTTDTSLSGAGGNTSATATTDVPTKLQRVVTFVDSVTSKKYGYSFGGGHDSFSGPYDCSGLASAIGHVMGVVSSPMSTGPFSTFGKPGEGQYVTWWVHETGDPHQSHMYTTVKYGGQTRKAEAGGGTDNGPSGWRPASSPVQRSGFVPRHAEGW